MIVRQSGNHDDLHGVRTVADRPSEALTAERDLRVQPASVLDATIARLREAMLLGLLLPGQRLVEADLTRRLGISRSSLREALRRLEAERLVELVPYRGAFVAKLDPAEITEIGEVWSLLTGEAVYRFANRATDASLAELKASAAAVAVAAKTADRLRLIEATNAFFGIVLRGAGNETLATIIRNMVLRINFLRAQALADPARRRRHLAELREVVERLNAGDAVGARQAVRVHIDYACRGASASAERDLVA
jgi:DNA-binding GntR family transcriptional regulator